jgi:hypothetical protein
LSSGWTTFIEPSAAIACRAARRGSYLIDALIPAVFADMDVWPDHVGSAFNCENRWSTISFSSCALNLRTYTQIDSQAGPLAFNVKSGVGNVTNLPKTADNIQAIQDLHADASAAASGRLRQLTLGDRPESDIPH